MRAARCLARHGALADTALTTELVEEVEPARRPEDVEQRARLRGHASMTSREDTSGNGFVSVISYRPCEVLCSGLDFAQRAGLHVVDETAHDVHVRDER